MTSDDPSPGRDAPRLAAWVLVLGGASWLLAATGFVPERFVRAGAALWPLIVVGLGLDVWGVRRPPLGIPYSLLALLVVAVGGLFFGAPAARSIDGSIGFSESLGEANRAEIALYSGMTSLLVRGGAPEGVLAEGTAFGAARLELDARGRAVRRLDVVVRGPAGRPLPGSAIEAADAELRLTDRVPVSVTARGGGRATTLDLTGLDLASVEYIGATGPSSITLGGVGPQRFDADITGGNGPLDVAIPPGSRLNLRLEAGPGGALLRVGARTDATIVLRGGDGPLTVAVPEDARVRVVVEDPGTGIVSVPERLQQVSSVGDGEAADIFETPGYRDVIPVVDIRIEEAGGGPIVIR